MKRQISLLLVMATAVTVRGQFNSGSSGSYGRLDIQVSTNLPMPLDGVFRCTSIHVATGATLRFVKNPANTPVYLLATDDVIIAGTIDVSGGDSVGRMGGVGGPGGFAGGDGGDNGIPPGDGLGPGGGRSGIAPVPQFGSGCGGSLDAAGAGSYATDAAPYVSAARAGYSSTNKGIRYGSQLLVPMLGGSGGGGTTNLLNIGGGGGGGAILIASNTRIDVSGNILANGGEGYHNRGGNDISGCNGVDQHINPGSGGGIRLVAPVVAGNGSLSATGPQSGNRVLNHGRIRIDGIDLQGLAVYSIPERVIGSYMVTMPPGRLGIVNVAGVSIGTSGPATIFVPNGAPTNQTVTVEASGFGKVVPIRVALTPRSGSRVLYEDTIDNTAGNSVTRAVPVLIPPNTLVTVEVWTGP